MGYRNTFLFGFGAGYVMGSRAGRQRYEQLVRAARGLAENPAVHAAGGVLQAQATQLAEVARARSRGTTRAAAAPGATATRGGPTTTREFG